MIAVEALTEAFRRRFPEEGRPSVIVSPGRVDLLGSHNDYNGLQVLTLTLDRAISIAFVPSANGRALFENVNSAFEPVAFDLFPEIPKSPQGDWANYIKAAAQWTAGTTGAHRGVTALVASDLPMGQGLSSSSALVCGAALAFLHANNLRYDRLRLAEAMARAEHYVGTAGGGMDQASCLLGQAHHALRLDFYPLRARPYPIPEAHDFLLVDTLIRTAKTKEHLDTFNRRVVECRLAAAMLAREFEVEYDPDSVLLLGQLPDDLVDVDEAAIDRQLARVFHRETYRLEEVAAHLRLAPGEVRRRWLALPGGRVFEEPADGFRIPQRCRHILTEARRVSAATELFGQGRANGLDALIAQGYASSRDNYEVSLPPVDRLVAQCLEAGARAARLPGAGFGGSLVCVTPRGEANAVRNRLYETFYAKADPVRFPPGADPETMLKETCFQVIPSHGAQVLEADRP